ncbi:Bacterial extracellular solute-binding protein, family 3 [compost metagenome]
MAQEGVITIRSDYWCPYICDPHSSRPGYMVEAVKAIFEKQGYQVDFKVTNRARAIKEVRKNKINALLGGHKDHKGFIVPTKSVGSVSNYLFAKPTAFWSYKNGSSIKGKRIGIINGYSYGNEIDQLIRSHPDSFVVISGERPLKQILKMMEADRLDGFIENPAVLKYLLGSLHKSLETYKIASANLATESLVYLSFAPMHPQSELYSSVFSKGMIQLRKTGELRQILEKYGMKDWEETPLLSIAKGPRP